MNAKELIQLNNEKRESLNEENLAYYEDMLLYIRATFNRSEQHTEELLMELLDHLLDAQSNGKTATEVFGDDPKSYCKEMIKELPKEKKISSAIFIFYLACYGLAWASIPYGIISLFLDTPADSVQLGSAAIIVTVNALLMVFCVFLVFKLIGWTTYNQIHKVLELFLYMLVFILFVVGGLFLSRSIPSFGPAITLSPLIYIVIGVILFGISYVLNKAFKITKA
ncbi:DUF1129 domain-containing protein [Radiobacillus kanasensis]|uniref:DUF1129 family protein n=1 Tax=Radiobacillus kanasensis TaxID=2844358 RepID=UPI001E4F253C|nr:DUF1129 family protein [Radiobacillus kanasensis]UFT99799.1 DUF1129 domain-containing protein [Radiobacillus kanasensis]